MPKVELVHPTTNSPLVESERGLVCSRTGALVAPVSDGIPRFVSPEDDYADSFGWQWNKWTDTLSDARNTGNTKYELLCHRTHFESYDLEGKTLLECGMGGGDDTEALLRFPWSEVHAFDLSNSVDRARKYLDDERLTISQASIYEIPYPDEAFDFVFCHRVLQHTPDPVAALSNVCRKVKPGGVLFASCYKFSLFNMMNYKYKYRWLTKRLPHRVVYAFVDRLGGVLHRVNKRLYGYGLLTQAIAVNFVPFEHLGSYGDLEGDDLIELEKLVTFDALTPVHDHPLTARTFRRTIEAHGFLIEHFHDPSTSPLYCTAVRR